MTKPVHPRVLRTTPDTVSIEWDDGTLAHYPGIWLRDNRREDRDPHNGQRLIDIADVPMEPKIRSATVADGRLTIEWATETHRDGFDLEWLAARAGVAGDGSLPPAPVPWLEGAARDARGDFAWLSSHELHQDPVLRLAWLTRLLEDGMAFVSDVPCTPAALLDTVAPLGRVSETNYGQAFDVRAVPAPVNLAYSDLGLGLHTDNPYRDPVPGYQALHVLLASPEGGDSLFADGFALAAHLRSLDPSAFDLLSRTAVPFRYVSADADLYAERPLIEVSLRGAVTAVHYNNRSIAPLPIDGRDVQGFYAAYGRFAALLREPRHQLAHKLHDGELVVFDNRRILHGRTAFSSARHARHLRGCYLSRDSIHSERALLHRRLREPQS
jgi:gamma-butyrobetaine dioxygenase